MFLKATKRRMVGGSPTHKVVVRGLPVWLFLSCTSSPTSLETLEPSYALELMQYEGIRFALVATNKS